MDYTEVVATEKNVIHLNTFKSMKPMCGYRRQRYTSNNRLTGELY